MASPGDLASIFGATHEDITYTLSVTDVDASLLRVASFRAVEELSTPFKYTIAVATDPESTATLEEALGRDASFTIARDGKVVREVHGIVTDVAPDGTFIGKTQARVVFVLEARLANLRYSGGFRIFQDLPIHEIVKQLCAPEQIETFWSVHPIPQKREYCTQLDESDLSFITRLASEEGMHYFFKHADGKTTLVFTNEPRGYDEIEPDLSIAFHDDEGAITDEHVRSILRGSAIRTGAFEHRDYNFLEPGKTLVARAETPGKETTGNSHKREWRDYPGRYIDKDGAGKALAEQRLDEVRSDSVTLSGTAYSLRFSAGKTFTLSGHRDEGFNRALLLTRVETVGVVQGASREAGGFRGSMELTSFVAVPADVAIHPRRISKPSSRVQSARVVGPKDGDPFVDERGRVKVQFFWDRDGKFDEKSSCWVRMMTPVAHEDEGFWQAHKVGSEVIVGFIDDDIDRPLIFGAVYNAVQPQPHPLPSQVAKSTWKTRSIPGNAGFNEITQDNTAGNENLFMHAQKNRTTMVLSSHSETVGANQSRTIGANQSVTVGANQSLTVGANRTKTVAANDTTTVGGHRHEDVTKGEDVTIKQGRSHTIETGDDSLAVTVGNRNVKVALADTHHAQTKVESIDVTYELKAGTSITIHHPGDSTLFMEAGKASLTTTSEITLSNPSGSITLANNKVTIDAVDEISLQCGASSISLKNDGTIAVSGGKQVSVSSASSALSVEPAKASLNGPMTDIAAKGILKVNGGLVKIN